MAANRIKSLRHEKKLGLTQLAEKVGLDPYHMALVENGYMIRLPDAWRIASVLGTSLVKVFPEVDAVADRVNDPEAIRQVGLAGIDISSARSAFHFVLSNGIERTVWISGPESYRLFTVLQDPIGGFVEFDTLTERIAINVAHLHVWQFHNFSAEQLNWSSFDDQPKLRLWSRHRAEPITIDVDHDLAGTEDPEDYPLRCLFSDIDTLDEDDIESVEGIDGEVLFFKARDVIMLSIHRAAVEPELLEGFDEPPDIFDEAA